MKDKEHIDHNNLRAYKKLQRFIVEGGHPCMMAQTVFKTDEVSIRSYDGITEMHTARALLRDVEDYLAQYDFGDNSLETFIAVFPHTKIAGEEAFETQLWTLLQNLHHCDPKPWDPTVGKDPAVSNFSFSLAGKAFYVVGMHPKSSRMARRAPCPTLVFNLHDQFQNLREMGVYERVRDTIRERDRELQGHINPMLEDFGSGSEAKQYSGRKVPQHWQCPFQPKKPKPHRATYSKT